MSIRGIIANGLLDSPSEIITMGFDFGALVLPDTFGKRTMASLREPKAMASLREPKTMADIREDSQ